MKDIAVDAVGVHANEYVLFAGDLSVDEYEMGFVIEPVHIADGLKFAPGSANAPCCFTFDETFSLQAVANEVGYGDHLEAVAGAEGDEFGHAGHGAIRVHDFADHTAGLEAGEAGQIDGGFGLAGAHQYAAGTRAEREHMAGARQILRLAARIDGDPDGVGAVIG